MPVEIDKQGFMQNLANRYGIAVGSPESIFYTKVFKEVMDMSNTPLDVNTVRLEKDLEKANTLLDDLNEKLVEISGNRIDANSKPNEYKSYLTHIGVYGDDITSISIRKLRLLITKYTASKEVSEEVVEVLELILSAMRIRLVVLQFTRIKSKTNNGLIRLPIQMLTEHDRMFNSTTLSYSTFRYVKPKSGKKFYSIAIKDEHLYFLAIILKDLEFKKEYLDGNDKLVGKILNKPSSSVTKDDRIAVMQSIYSVILQDSVLFGTDNNLLGSDNKLVGSQAGRELMVLINNKISSYSDKSNARTPDGKHVLGKNLFSDCSAILSTIRASILLTLREKEEMHGIRLVHINNFDMIIEVDNTMTEQEILSKYIKMYTESAPKGWFTPLLSIGNPEEREIPVLDNI